MKNSLRTLLALTGAATILTPAAILTTSCSCSHPTPTPTTHTMEIVPPESYTGRSITISTTQQSFAPDLHLTTTITPTLLGAVVDWTLPIDSTPNHNITINSAGTVQLAAPITTPGTYNFTVQATLQGEPHCYAQLPFTLTVVQAVKYIPYSGPDSWIAYSDDTHTTITGPSTNWSSDHLSEYNALFIPNTVTTIAYEAFENKIVGDNMKISLVFQADSQLQHLRQYCFNNCTGLTGSLTLPNTILSSGDEQDNAWFHGCTGFNGTLILSSAMTHIGNSTFAECKNLAGNLVIPNSVTNIDNGAFADCASMLGNLTLSPNLTTVSDRAFEKCRFHTLTNPASQTIGTVGYIAQLGGVKALIDTPTFTKDSNILGDCAFGSNLVFPDSLTEIKESLFAHYHGIYGPLNLSNCSSLTSIGRSAFSQCDSLSGVLTLPTSLTSIGAQAFYDVPFTSLGNPVGQKFTSSATIVQLGSVKALATSTTPNWDGTFDNNSTIVSQIAFGTNLSFPSTVTSLSYQAFFGCTNIYGSLTLPTTLTNIANECFLECYNFDKISAAYDSLPTIGTDAFDGWATSGTIHNSGTLTSQALLDFLKTKGLTGADWHVE